VRISLSESGLRALEIAEWPGNIRQLANVVHAGVIRAQSEGAVAVGPNHLFPQAIGADPPEGDFGFHDAVRHYQKQLLVRALTQNDWNVSEAARSLDLARSTMNDLIRQHGLRRADD